LVLGNEGVDDVLAERLSLVENVVRNAEVLAGASGVVAVFRSAASAYLLLAVRVPQMQGDADQVVTRFVQQRCSDGGVHPAAHRYQHSFHFGHQISILNKSTVGCYT
jgi:hypothetical protein